MFCVVSLLLFVPAFGHNSHENKRVLRGGSYSRGGGTYNRGGSSGGNSSYNRNRNRNRNNNRRRNSGGMGTMGKVFAGLALAGLGLALMAMFFPAFGAASCGMCLPACLAGTCCGLFAASNKLGSANQQADFGEPARQTEHEGEVFEDCVARAKFDVENSRGRPPQHLYSRAQPYSGQYSTTFVEAGVTHNATLNLTFTPDLQGNGFKLSGEGRDIDGDTVIEDGHSNFDGTAWWKERNTSGVVGLQVLSRGRFDFQQRTFQGTWMASSMVNGSYISFVAMTQEQPRLHQPYASTIGADYPTATVVPGAATAYQTSIPVVSGTVVHSSNIPASSYSPPAQKPS